MHYPTKGDTISSTTPTAEDDTTSDDFVCFLYDLFHRVGEVVVAEMWSPIEMRELDEVVMIELWSPIEMRELGEVVMIELWSPIEMRKLGEGVN